MISLNIVPLICEFRTKILLKNKKTKVEITKIPKNIRVRFSLTMKAIFNFVLKKQTQLLKENM